MFLPGTPHVPGEPPLWVRQFSALGMLSRLKKAFEETNQLRNYIPKE